MVQTNKTIIELDPLDAIYLFNLAKGCACKESSPRWARATFERIAEAAREAITRQHSRLTSATANQSEELAR